MLDGIRVWITFSSGCLDFRKVSEVLLVTAMSCTCCLDVIPTSAISDLEKGLLRWSLTIHREWSMVVSYMVIRRVLSSLVGQAGVLVMLVVVVA